MKILKQNKKNINEIITALENGAVLVCPTDTVYGFLANAENKKAVDKIYKIKKRLKNKPLPIFARDFKMVKELAEIDERQIKILTLRLRSGQAKYWPGKFTFVLNKKKGVKLYGTDKKTIALNNIHKNNEKNNYLYFISHL